MTLTQKFAAISLAAFLTATASNAMASGFQLKEQGAAGQGASFAGETARAEDLGTAFYNPAGIMLLDNPNQVYGGVTAIDPFAHLQTRSVTPGAGGQPNAGNDNGNDAGKVAYVPNIAASFEVAPNWRVGMTLNTPFGLSTEYDQNWVGRYFAIDSEVQTINFTPTVATKLTKQLSVAGGVQIQEISARLTNGINQNIVGAPDGQAKVTGDDVGYGVVASALYQLDQATNIGVDYRSRVVHKLDGDIRFQDISPIIAAGSPAGTFSENAVTAKVVTPDTLSFGMTHDLDKQWKLLADVSWTNWSSFHNLTVRNQGSGVVRSNVEEDWHDTYFYSVGTEYKATDRLKLRTGVAYDKSPVDTSHRTFRIPDSDRLWLSGGTSYQLTDAIGIDAAYTHIFARGVSATETDPVSAVSGGSVTGTYRPHVDIVSVSASYKF